MTFLQFFQEMCFAHLCKDIYGHFASFGILVLAKLVIFLAWLYGSGLGYWRVLAKHVFGTSVCSDKPILASGPLKLVISATCWSAVATCQP